MSPEEIQRQLIQKQQDIGQRTASMPQNLNTATDPDLQAYRGQHAAKIQELYEADKRLADRYANPESEAYLADPYAREKARSIQSQATAGEISDIMSKIAERKSYLEDSYEKGLKLWQLGFDMLDKIFGNARDMEDAKESKSSSSADAANLTAILDSIRGVKQNAAASKPTNEGGTLDKVRNSADLIAKLNQKRQQFGLGADEEIRTQFLGTNKDGTKRYRWYTVSPETYFGEESERQALENPADTLKEMLAASIAAAPKQSSDIENIFSQFAPEEDNTTEAKKDLVSDISSAKENKITKEKFIQIAKISYPELSEAEIKKIVNTVW